MRTSWNYYRGEYNKCSMMNIRLAASAFYSSQVTTFRIRLGVLLLLMAAMFCVQQALLWEVFNCEECENMKCTEIVFDVPGSTWSNVYQDQAVKDYCGVNSRDPEAEKKWQSISRRFHDAPGNKAPDIVTKCGNVKPELISYVNASHNRDHNVTKIPNVVHYVSFNAYTFSFLHYLSVLSVHRNARPKFIYFHGDTLPVGKWWERTVKDVANLYFVKRERTIRIQGYKTPWIEHSSNIIRMQTLWENGGIYLDTDILVLRPLTPLLQQDFVLGRVTPMSVGNGFILSRPHAPFMCMWLQNYRTYQPWPWAFSHNGGEVAHQLAKAVPDQLHIEVGTVHNPNALHADQLYRRHMDWSRSYTMHIWKRQGHVPSTINETHALDSTLGEVMRYVYYGDTKLIHDGNLPAGHFASGSAMLFLDQMMRMMV